MTPLQAFFVFYYGIRNKGGNNLLGAIRKLKYDIEDTIEFKYKTGNLTIPLTPPLFQRLSAHSELGLHRKP